LGAGADAIREGFLRIEQPLTDALPGGCALVWVTNSSRAADRFGPTPQRTPAGHRLVCGARKPLPQPLHREVAGLLWRGESVVVDDQWLTDGLLAWRLRARFVLLHDRRHRKPLWAAAEHVAGLLFIRPLFARERPGPRDDEPSRSRRWAAIVMTSWLLRFWPPAGGASGKKGIR
jgi:hypothetical protein